MPREREFDPAAALESIMSLFWRQGYLDTSIEDLVAATGVSRYGLYGTFGGKQEMLLAALDHYAETVVGPRLSGMEGPEASLPSIYGYFEELGHASTSERRGTGCLMCSIATELAPHDRASAAKVKRHLARMTAAFRNALTNAQRKGEIGPAVDVEAQAQFLTGTVQGTAVLHRAGSDRQALENIVHVALSGLG